MDLLKNIIDDGLPTVLFLVGAFRRKVWL